METTDKTNGAVDSPALLRALSDTFGFDSLRSPQEQALTEVMTGDDVVIIMPTGTGKSLCYQLPGVIEGGFTLVISPLISLMKDQVDGLCALGLRACSLNSSLSSADYMDSVEGVRSGAVQFLFCAPERLSNEGFLSLIKEADVARVVIDEAHCVSSWGHDFRPDYLRVGVFLDKINRPQTLALTATATPRVRDDICGSLGMKDPRVVVTGFDRPNLSIDVVRVYRKDDRQAALLSAVKTFDTGGDGAVLIYTASRKNAEAVAELMNRRGHECGIYHAGLNAEERNDVQDAFMIGSLNMVAATNAFGMGIDRSDVRQVIHYDMPGSLEAWYQEIGRAGRDGRPSRGVLLFSEMSVKLQHFFIDRSHPSPDLLNQVYELLCEQTAAGAAVFESQLESAYSDEPAVVAAARRLVGWGLARRVGAKGGGFMADGGEQTLEACLAAFPLEERREADELLLHSIVTCARGQRCRWRAILAYFEGVERSEGCGRCDVCAGNTAVRCLTDEENVVLRKVLSGVARVRGYAGKRKIASMLIGSQSREIAGSWLERLSTFGILEQSTGTFVGRVIDTCLDAGYIETRGGRYPVLHLTSTGADVLAGRCEPEVSWPDTSSVSSLDRVVPAGSTNEEVAARLQAWRREEAAKAGMPPYVIFSNSALNELCRLLPRDLQELEAVKGFGPKRIARHGAAILKCIAMD